jgi:protein ImuB
MSNRIACLHLPSFPLQIHVRLSPHLAGKPFAIAAGKSGEPSQIIACSRAAWSEGARPQMTPTQARALAPACTFIPADAELYRHALVALAESLLPHSMTIDIGQQYREGVIGAHCSIYLLVPPRRRGVRYGEGLLAEITRLGYRGRAGIADDRFTAWAAAVSGRSRSDRAACPERRRRDAGDRGAEPFAQVCTSVPRGGAAAYLAPLPLDLLPLSAEVRHLLSTLGIRTLGEFATLPPPTVGRRWRQGGVDHQRLAAGLGPTALTAFTPSEVIAEKLELESPITELEPLSFMLRPLADRVCRRLYGRGGAAARMTLFLLGRDRDHEVVEIELEPSRPTLSGAAVVDLARATLAELRLAHPITELGLVVNEITEPEIEELDLFDYRDAAAAPNAVDVALARLRAAFGDGAVGAAELTASYRPETSFRLTAFHPPASRSSNRQCKVRRPRSEPPAAAVMNGFSGALRLIEPPAPQPRGLGAITLEGSSARVIRSRGPARLQSEWWTSDPVERDYYEVETDDGGRYWVFRHHGDGRYYLHGVFD